MRFDGKHRRAHTVAWELVNGPIPEGLQVRHLCNNPPCCNVEHLAVGTHADNMADKVAAGRQSRMPGESHPLAKLTEADVRVIRALAATGVTHKVIAEKFSIRRKYVSDVVCGRSWKHVE